MDGNWVGWECDQDVEGDKVATYEFVSGLPEVFLYGSIGMWFELDLVKLRSGYTYAELLVLLWIHHVG